MGNIHTELHYANAPTFSGRGFHAWRQEVAP